MAISNQSRDTWRRLGTWYGADTLERKFGLTCPPDWCDAIDGLDRETLAKVLAETKHKFPTWLPGLPEFEALISQLSKPKTQDVGPGIAEQLHDYVVKSRWDRLTPTQRVRPWTYRGQFYDAPDVNGKVRHNHGVNYMAVEIPADGDAPGMRVTVEDMRAGM